MGPDPIAASITDSLSITVPNILHLEPSRVNWAIFLICFQEAMEANGKWGHFNGTNKCPELANASTPSDNNHKVIANWNKSKTLIQYMLLQQLPNSCAV